jgi:hypothetical protein
LKKARMPRFYLHFESIDGLHYDSEGFEADDATAALCVARRAAAQMLADALLRGDDLVAFSIHLDASDGTNLASIDAGASLSTTSDQRL